MDMKYFYESIVLKINLGLGWVFTCQLIETMSTPSVLATKTTALSFSLVWFVAELWTENSKLSCVCELQENHQEHNVDGNTGFSYG